MGRVERHVDTAGLEHRQNGGDGVLRAGQQQPDEVAGADAQGGQLPRKLFSAQVQFRVGTRPVQTLKGHRRRGPGNLCFKALMKLHRHRHGLLQHSRFFH